MLHIVSGVAVADSGTDRQFVFGCYPQEAGTGGTGIMGKDDENPTSIQVGEDKMQAGSVFVVDELNPTCSYTTEHEPHICLGHLDPKPEAEEPDTEVEEEPEKEPEKEKDDKEQSDSSSETDKEVVSESDDGKDKDDKQTGEQNGSVGQSTNSASAVFTNILYIVSLAFLPALPFLC